VLGAIVAVVVLIALMSWLNSRALQPDEPAANVAAVETNAAAPTATPAPAPAISAQGPVVLTATAPIWLQVSERGGATLFSGTLQPGQTYAVPATATAPVLKTGKPEALSVKVGDAAAGPVGPPATTVSNVSLLPADLLKPPVTGASTPPPSAAPPPAAAAPRRTPARAAPAPAQSVPPPPATVETPPTSNSGE
jgi:hypothetical protein